MAAGQKQGGQRERNHILEATNDSVDSRLRHVARLMEENWGHP
jgi:hypothetical protein